MAEVNSQQEHNELIAIFQNSTRNIEFWKTQQWRIVYYVSLVYAAFVGLKLATLNDNIPSHQAWINLVLIGLALVAMALGVRMIYMLDISQQQERERLDTIYAQFSLLAKRIRGSMDRDQADRANKFVTLLLMLALVLGWLLTGFVVSGMY